MKQHCLKVEVHFVNILSRIQSRGTNELAIAMLYNGNYINAFVIIDKVY